MADVLNLAEFRQLRDAEMVHLDFIGFPFTTPEGKTERLTYTLTVKSELVAAVIAEIRETGGISIPNNDMLWFLPWPPAAVRVRPSTEAPLPTSPDV